MRLRRLTRRAKQRQNSIMAPLSLGHTKIEGTVRYLGIEVDDALAIGEQVDVNYQGRAESALGSLRL